MAEKEEEVVILEASDENFAPIEDENQEDAKLSQEAEQNQEKGKAKKKKNKRKNTKHTNIGLVYHWP